jgi:deoxyribose-phosphate aldolase
MNEHELIERITKEVVRVLQTQGNTPIRGLPPVSDEGVRCSVGTYDCTACGLCTSRREQDVNRLVNAGACRVTATLGTHPSTPQITRMIDHTMLKPDTKENDIRQLCQEAREHCFASVCVNPSWVSLASQLLKGSGVMVCTVIGFPLGATATSVKAFETSTALADGADEIDMVINIGALKTGNTRLVEDDIRAVVTAARGFCVKTILETTLLTDEEKVTACILAKKAGATFVKTSTGFGGGGATAKDIALMRKTVGPDMGVKASGGVRDLQTAINMLEAGATRIGASASVEIVTGKTGEGDY